MIRKIYLYYGIATILIFIATGQYLLHAFPDKTELDLSFRVMQRSRHIFILMSGFTLTALGLYFVLSTIKWIRAAQLLATILLFSANTLFIGGFFYEVDISFIPKTPMIHIATYIGLAGIVLHGSVLLKKDEVKRNKP
jgi:hypothetical protein